MNTLIYGTGAFGFAILNHLSKNNKNSDFFIYGINVEVRKYLQKNKKHPIFFKNISLGNNAIVVDDLNKKLNQIDLLIMAIPSNAVPEQLKKIKKYLKKGVIILNLSKGVDNINLKTVGESVGDILGDFDHKYGALSGGMIALELVEANYMGADLAVDDLEVGEKIKSIFSKENLDIKIVLNNTKAVELYGALKNVIAICIGYYQGIGYDASSVGYFMCRLYDELELLMKKFSAGSLSFSHYSLGGDLIATCFGKSRNREFGKMLGKGKKPTKILKTLEESNKIAEGYYTFKGLYKMTKGDNNFIEINKIGAKIFD